jgi:sulfide:quinone oxidoreductase
LDKNYRHIKDKNIFAIGVAVAIAPPEATPVPTGVPKTGYMTVKMAKMTAATIASDVTGKTPPIPDETGVVCLMDMGEYGGDHEAYPVLPPRQSSYMKKAIWAKWMKVRFEEYFLWKMRRGLSNLP